MKGRVTAGPLCERLQSPEVNAPISKFYQPGEIVNIKKAVIGDTYDGNNRWYQLDNDAFVWSGAVAENVESQNLEKEELRHFVISYRNRRDDGRIDLDSKEPPETLYFAPVELPVFSDSIIVNQLIPNAFARGVADAAKKINREHVFIYIHGYQMFSSLKLDLFTNFVQNYMRHPSKKIAKVIFMVWPAQSLSRKRIDDRSVEFGKNFTKQDFFETFVALSRELKKDGRSLNLVVHSFGHQLLNGMIKPVFPALPPEEEGKVFENIFLMAPDITHLTAQNGGAQLDNYYPENAGKTDYDYTGLDKLAKNVYAFYDKYDTLLYTSTRKFVHKDKLHERYTTDKYRNLGNFAEKEIIPQSNVLKNITYININTLPKVEEHDTLSFPFQETPRHTRKVIDKTRESGDIRNIKPIGTLFRLSRFPNHHRYLFTYRPVVDQVISLL